MIEVGDDPAARPPKEPVTGGDGKCLFLVAVQIQS
jgi:hypothetical protein